VEGLIYLVGAFKENDFPRQFLLHRMVSVEVQAERATAPTGFTLKGYVASKEFAYPITDKRIKLKALFEEHVATYLWETPLDASQKLTCRRDGRILLEAEVADTVQLRYWLKGFGENVEVGGPKKLRAEFAEMASVLADRYCGKE
jgi:predicted DNA-binding transcriptional regulator YafY